MVIDGPRETGPILVVKDEVRCTLLLYSWYRLEYIFSPASYLIARNASIARSRVAETSTIGSG